MSNLITKWRRDAAYRQAFPCSAAKRWLENRHMFAYQEDDTPPAREARVSFGSHRGKTLLGWRQTYRIMRRAKHTVFETPVDMQRRFNQIDSALAQEAGR